MFQLNNFGINPVVLKTEMIVQQRNARLMRFVAESHLESLRKGGQSVPIFTAHCSQSLLP
jgi:hypothetical protein